MRDTLILVIELVALFFGVTFLVQMFQRRLGQDQLRNWMGGHPVLAALKGIAVGFVTPFCTFTAIPLLLGLRKAGVAPAGYVAFIVAAPVLDPVLFGALVVIVGFGAAAIYVVVAFTAALALALAAQHIGIHTQLKPLPAEVALVGAGAPDINAPTDVPASACTPTELPWQGRAVETRQAASSAVALLRSFAPLLAVGIAIGLAIEAWVSPTTVANLTGDNGVLSIPVAAFLGTPLYFSTELFIPIADALRGAGLSTGAIVALTIAGAGANIPEFVILSRLAKPKLITIFALYVFGVATIGGLIAESLA